METPSRSLSHPPLPPSCVPCREGDLTGDDVPLVPSPSPPPFPTEKACVFVEIRCKESICGEIYVYMQVFCSGTRGKRGPGRAEPPTPRAPGVSGHPSPARPSTLGALGVSHSRPSDPLLPPSPTKPVFKTARGRRREGKYVKHWNKWLFDRQRLAVPTLPLSMFQKLEILNKLKDNE